MKDEMELENAVLRNLLAHTTRAYEEQVDELAEEKELAQVTLASIGDGVVTTDAEGRVRYLNPVAEEITGWHRDEAEGRALAERPAADLRGRRRAAAGAAAGRPPAAGPPRLPDRAHPAGAPRRPALRGGELVGADPRPPRPGGGLGDRLPGRLRPPPDGAAARPPGEPRSAHRPAQPQRLRRLPGPRPGQRPRRRGARPRLPRPRPVQGGQRHLRPLRRRRAAAPGRRPAARPHGRERRGGAPRRRRVRPAPPRLPAGRRPRAGRRPAPRALRLPLPVAGHRLRGRRLGRAGAGRPPVRQPRRPAVRRRPRLLRGQGEGAQPGAGLPAGGGGVRAPPRRDAVGGGARADPRGGALPPLRAADPAARRQPPRRPQLRGAAAHAGRGRHAAPLQATSSAPPSATA